MTTHEVVVKDEEVTVYLKGVVVSVNLTSKGEDLVTVNRDAPGPTERISRLLGG